MYIVTLHFAHRLNSHDDFISIEVDSCLEDVTKGTTTQITEKRKEKFTGYARQLFDSQKNTHPLDERPDVHF